MLKYLITGDAINGDCKVILKIMLIVEITIYVDATILL